MHNSRKEDFKESREKKYNYIIVHKLLSILWSSWQMPTHGNFRKEMDLNKFLNC